MRPTEVLRRELVERRLRGLTTAAAPGIQRVERSGALVASYGQRRLWFLEQLEPGSREYVTLRGLRLRGELDEGALERALNRLVERHEVLRTRLEAVDGEPVQVVEESARVELERGDEERAGRAFDLGRTPMLRAVLSRRGEGEWVLHLALPHVATDGWSEGVLARELGELYGAERRGEEAELGELAVQYADYAAWQRGRELEERLGYWRERLGGVQTLELASDRARPAVRDGAGAVWRFEVPAEVGEGLRELAREQGATLYMGLLAAFQVLLSRWSGQEDVVVGSPVAGRERGELEGLIGFFVNTLVLRGDVSGEPSFRELLGRVRETALGAYANQEVPFERLVEELGVERDLSRTPLVQVVFALQNVEPAAYRLEGLEVESLAPARTAAKFDLQLSVSERADGSLAAGVEYATALFDEATIARLAGHYRTLLAGIVADPDRRVHDLDLLTAPERRALARWSGRGEEGRVERCLHELFEEQARRRPGAEAVSWGEERVSYGELNRRANRLAHRLRGLGVGAESVVGVRMERSAELVVALLGVLKAGAAYLPLDPETPEERQAYMVADAGAVLVVSEEWLEGEAGELEGSPEEDPEGVSEPGHLAYVIYTSGSTGRPKGVMVEHRNAVRLFAVTVPELGVGEEDVWTLFHSYAFDFSVWELWGALLHGGRLVVVGKEATRSPGELLGLLEREGVTVLSQTPSAFRGLVEEARGELALRLVVFGGEELRVEELEPWLERYGEERPRLVNMYGITETTVHVTRHRVVRGDVRERRGSPIGRQLGDLSLHVLDGRGREVPVGVAGELYVGGGGVARGYLGRPGLTAERFLPDALGRRSGERLYRTGDRARRLGDGSLEYLGRNDGQVKVRGFRIELGEIESALVRHPDVREAVASAMGEAEGGARLVAHVVAVAGKEVRAGELRGYLAARLPAYMLPAAYVGLSELPLTSSGKVDRRALPAPDGARPELEQEMVEPRTAEEAEVAAALAGVLGLERVGVNDSFFELGGDSIRALRLVAALRAKGLDVAVLDVFRHQTAAGLGELAAGRAGGAEEMRLVGRFELVTEADRELLGEEVEDAYPMALVQAGMVYELEADPEAGRYHNVTSYAVRDRGAFSLEALREAARVVTGRHEILRTSFDLTGYSEPMQLVHREVEMEVGVRDLRHLAVEEHGAAVRAAIAEERRRPLDLRRAPLMRLVACLLGEDAWQLLFVENHAILDGWSHNSVLSELLQCYREVREGGRPRPFDAPAVRFADFVAAERQSLSSGEDHRYWERQLAGLERIALPEGWREPAGAGPEGHATRVRIDDLEPALRRLAAAAGASYKSVLLAAHVKVLGTITPQRPFLTGMVCNGRQETAGGDRVRGMFLNTVPFVAPPVRGTWRDLVRAVFAKEAELWPHRRYPVPAMQREWGRGGPLIEVGFNYIDFHVLDRELVDLRETVDVSPNEFALRVVAKPRVIEVVTQSSRVAGWACARVAALFRAVLEAMAADADGPAWQGCIPADERFRALHQAAGAALPPPDRCLHELFEEQVQRAPDAPAAVWRGGGMTYAELNRQSDRLAGLLIAAGVTAEEPVGVLLERSPELLVALLGVLKAGAAYLPIETATPPARIAAVLADAGARRCLAGREHLAELAGAEVAPLVLSPGLPELHDRPAVRARTAVRPDQLAAVYFTSGSTGRPKGVACSHRGWVNRVAWSQRHWPLRPGDAVLHKTTLTYDDAALELFWPLLAGGCVALLAPGAHRDPRAMVEAAIEHRVVHLQFVPSVLALFLEVLRPDDRRRLLPALRTVVSSGEALPGELWGRFRERLGDGVALINTWGVTEASIDSTSHVCQPGDEGEAFVPIGRVMENDEVLVLDAEMEPVPAGVSGQLFVGGVGLARGYVHDPRRTGAAFVAHPFRDGERLYATGDRGFVRQDGSIVFLGRGDGQVKVRGVRVELGEVEAVLGEHPSVRRVAVEAPEVTPGERRLVAYVAGAADVDELREHARARLPEAMRPSGYVALAELPMTASGKLDRRRLPAVDWERRAAAGGYVAPRTALESRIAAVWREVLGVERVGVEDDFFELGGHSLLLMRVAARAQDQGLALTFRELAERRTVAGLAAALEERRAGRGQARALVWLRRSGRRRPLFCVHPGGGSSQWYRHLAERMAADRPVAAFEAPGLDMASTPLERTEDLAALYVAEMRAAQPDGPYHVMAWCGGSAIAFEMARQLGEAGELVEPLALIDPTVDVHEQAGAVAMLDAFERCERLFEAWRRPGGDDDRAALLAELLALLAVIVDDDMAAPPSEEDLNEHLLRRLRVWRLLHQSRMSYRFVPRAQRVLLVIGDDLAREEHVSVDGRSYARYRERWRELAGGGLDLRRLPGSHLGIMRPPHVGELARLLDKRLGEGIP